MGLFDKLMLARQISFKDKEGEIDLLNQRVVITPSNLLAQYTLEINKDANLVKSLYKTAKLSTKVPEGFAVGVGKTYGFSFQDYSNWFIDLNGLSGWGKARWIELDREKHIGVLGITNSPVATYLKGRVEKPCDHVIRGLIAGVASSAFRIELDMLEIECEALGAEECRFVLDKSETLKSKFAEVYDQQIGD